MRQVVVALEGGLGNQMFQYAAGRRLAFVNRARLSFVLSDRYGPTALRDYALDGFRIVADRPKPASPTTAAAPLPHRVLRERLVFNDAELAPVLAADPDATAAGRLLFDPAMLTRRGDATESVTLVGFWQDERYFADIAPLIRREFTLRQPLDARSAAMLAEIRSGPSAFLHVRRGDYVDAAQRDRFGLCPPEYYERAIAVLRDRVGVGLRLFAFSDDPEWLRASGIGGARLRIIDWNRARPERDLALMRACGHAIIANSSFGWWGAWLGERRGRPVIAPATWFAARPDFRDIVPARWLRLSAAADGAIGCSRPALRPIGSATAG